MSLIDKSSNIIPHRPLAPKEVRKDFFRLCEREGKGFERRRSRSQQTK